MTSGSAGEHGLGWLLEPARPGEAKVHIDIGESVPLTPEVQEALERLAQALQAGRESDVQGFLLSTFSTSTTPTTCNPRVATCQPRIEEPCAVYTTCRIIITE